jgi:hypothetical protein
MIKKLKTYFNRYTSTATLAFYRLAFGLMMLFSLIRFAALGWIEKLYILPSNRFTYYGFEWIPRLGNYTYLLFLIAALAAFCVAIGYKYRIAIITFFLCFTYIELLDKTTYLNHYYFISIVSFVFIFLPANAYFSVDAKKNQKLSFQFIPKWNVDILKILIAIVYIYAGLAKINSDWLLEAMPLKIWLPTNNDLPIIKTILNQNWVHYAFSWSGMIYDLAIPFLLLYKPTRKFAFVLVVVFHILTRMLFPIGVFPFVMIISSLVFFEPSFHEKILQKIAAFFKINIEVFKNNLQLETTKLSSKFIRAFLIAFIAFQLAFPFRYLLYPNELFWTEEGFRFSWRVMLMEKAGYTQFKVVDAKTKQEIRVNNSLFLTTFQEKQMSFQPDFILEYAHILRNYYKKQGVANPQVYIESYVALNGRLSQKYIDPNVNLANKKESFKPKNWILPFNDEIKGL